MLSLPYTKSPRMASFLFGMARAEIKKPPPLRGSGCGKTGALRAACRRKFVCLPRAANQAFCLGRKKNIRPQIIISMPAMLSGMPSEMFISFR